MERQKSMRVKCKDCTNELEGKCTITKTTVKLNKSRKCNDYEFEQSRELARLERKARVMDQQDRAYKAKMSELQRLVDEQQGKEDKAHPVTGDLSRFSTTASD